MQLETTTNLWGYDTCSSLPAMRLFRSAIVASVLVSSSPSYAQQKVFKHEGLYLQGSIGAAYWSSDFDSHEGHLPSHTVEGWGPAYGARLGHTWSGFTLGFGVEGRTIWAEERFQQGSFEWTDDDVHGVTTLGPFIDWYVYPRGGFHVGLMPGITPSDGVQAGVGICVWIGQDFRIWDHWWVGVEPRYFVGGAFYGGASSSEVFFVVTYNGSLRLRGARKNNAPPRSTPSFR